MHTGTTHTSQLKLRFQKPPYKESLHTRQHVAYLLTMPIMWQSYGRHVMSAGMQPQSTFFDWIKNYVHVHVMFHVTVSFVAETDNALLVLFVLCGLIM